MLLSQNTTQAPLGKGGAFRLKGLDAIRGLAVLLMLVHHFFYDLIYLFDVPTFFNKEWFFPLHIVIVILFMVAAGLAAGLQDCPSKRGVIRQALAALLLTGVTVVAYLAIEGFPGYILWNVLHILAVARILTYLLHGRIQKKVLVEDARLSAQGELYEVEDEDYGTPLTLEEIETMDCAEVVRYIDADDTDTPKVLSAKARTQRHMLFREHKLYLYLAAFGVFLLETLIRSRLFYMNNMQMLPTLDFLSAFPWLFLYLIVYFHVKENDYKDDWIAWEQSHNLNILNPLAFLGRHALVIYFIHQPIIWLILKAVTTWL